MTIEIHRPDGAFQNIEDVIMQTLEAAPPVLAHPGRLREGRTGADLIAAMQASPYREIEIEPERYRLTARDVAF